MWLSMIYAITYRPCRLNHLYCVQISSSTESKIPPEPIPHRSHRPFRLFQTKIGQILQYHHVSESHHRALGLKRGSSNRDLEFFQFHTRSWVITSTQRNLKSYIIRAQAQIAFNGSGSCPSIPSVNKREAIEKSEAPLANASNKARVAGEIYVNRRG
jgi:hypothetical protein